MKEIKNEKINIKNGNTIMDSSFAEMCINAAKNPGNTGMTIDRMESGRRIIEVAKKGGDVLVFEDADHENLLTYVNEMIFVFYNDRFIDFRDAVKNAKDPKGEVNSD